MSRAPANPLSYAAESWLYQHNPSAWGYHKAMLAEDHNERRQALIDLAGDEAMEAIRMAYEMRARS